MVTKLSDRLRRAGYKLTPPRLAVLEILEAEGRHLSPAEVLDRGRAIYPALSRATVYRTLELLIELGVLRPIYLGERGSRVARIEGGHQHLVCLDCGSVIHLDESVSDELEEILSKRLGYQVSSYLLELYGACPTCSQEPAAVEPPDIGG
ncbi:MAG: Fur family transcriptional regulator [Anaerolineae bacterium]